MKPAKKIEKLIKNINIQTNADSDKAVLSDVLEAYKQSKENILAVNQPNIWRIIMKSNITKLAAAAVLIILGGLMFWPNDYMQTSKWWLGASSAWGREVLAKLEKINVISCHELTILVDSDGLEHTSSTWDILYVSHDSYRRDIYDGNFLREIQWYIPEGNRTLHQSIRFDLGSYFVQRGEGSFGNYNPIERMRFYVSLLDKADRLLGEKVIENHNCVGFEISASKYGNNPEQWIDCIWFDVRTKLPIRIEQNGRPVTGQPDQTFTTILEQFNYNPELPANTFIPWIPEGFIYGHPDDIQNAEPKGMVQNKVTLF
jgi:hypothetical protein